MRYSSHDDMVSSGMGLADAKGPTYTLESLENHAVNVRTNSLDINAGLRKALVTLRGEDLVGGEVGKEPLLFGKLAEISRILTDTRSNQDDTFRLVSELLSLLDVDA